MAQKRVISLPHTEHLRPPVFRMGGKFLRLRAGGIYRIPHWTFWRSLQHVLNPIGVKDFAATSLYFAFDLLYYTRIPAKPAFIFYKNRIRPVMSEAVQHGIERRPFGSSTVATVGKLSGYAPAESLRQSSKICNLILPQMLVQFCINLPCSCDPCIHRDGAFFTLFPHDPSSFHSPRSMRHTAMRNSTRSLSFCFQKSGWSGSACPQSHGQDCVDCSTSSACPFPPGILPHQGHHLQRNGRQVPAGTLSTWH